MPDAPLNLAADRCDIRGCVGVGTRKHWLANPPETVHLCDRHDTVPRSALVAVGWWCKGRLYATQCKGRLRKALGGAG